MYTINPTQPLKKQRIIAKKPMKQIKWNNKKILNPKDGRKGGKGNKEQIGQIENNSKQGDNQPNHIKNHIKCN